MAVLGVVVSAAPVASDLPMVAALYVEEGGVYYDAPNVDCWPESRDARLYDGPWPVVAHPPCSRWAMPLAKVNQTRYGHMIGEDGGAFRRALETVRRVCGVLEHPANSAAWRRFNLPKPRRGRWIASPCGGWVTAVSQGAYGHPARKKTWLYGFGIATPPLDWSDPPPTAAVSWLNPKTLAHLRRLSSREASATPTAFRDLLLSIARSAA